MVAKIRNSEKKKKTFVQPKNEGVSKKDTSSLYTGQTLSLPEKAIHKCSLRQFGLGTGNFQALREHGIPDDQPGQHEAEDGSDVDDGAITLVVGVDG